jgi:hypothetical protein
MDERRFDEEASLLAAIKLSILSAGAERPIRWGRNGVMRETEEEWSCGFDDSFKRAQPFDAVGGRKTSTKTEQVMAECIA